MPEPARRYPDRSAGAIAERRARIVALAHEGHTCKEIAELVGVGSSTVYVVRREAGIAPTRAPNMTAAEVARAEEMLDAGASYAKVARMLGRERLSIMRRFPGRGWSAEKAAAYARHVRSYKANNHSRRVMPMRPTRGNQEAGR